MTSQEFEQRILAVERWANEQIGVLESLIARPPNYAIDPNGWHSHQWSMVPVWNQQIAEIEDLLRFVSLALNCKLFHEPLPPAPSQRHAELLARFIGD